MTRFRLAVLASHPIQYQTPLFRKLSQEPGLDLTVYFCSEEGLRPTYSHGFAAEYSWDIPLLSGYKYRFLRNISPFSNTQSFFRYAHPDIVLEIVRGKYGALWVNGYSTLTNWLAIFAACLARTPILFRGESQLLNEEPGLRRNFKRAILRPLLSPVKSFLSIGTLNEAFYLKYGVPQERIFRAPYSVDNNFFVEQGNRLMEERGNLRSEWGIAPDGVVILFVGMLAPWKRPFDLLRAFERMNALNAHLIYVGIGSEENSLQQYVAKKQIPRVLFAGFRNQSEISEFYVMADLLVLPSEREPWGLVVNEAMCFGLPIVASNRVGAAPDLVRNGVNGFVYPSRDVEKLSQLLADLVREEKKRVAMGACSYKLISTWSLDDTAAGVLSACRAIQNE